MNLKDLKAKSPSDLLAFAEELEVEFTPSPGHFTEWVRAIKGGPVAVSNFPDYSGPLSEVVLLGNLALWAESQRIDWDAKNLKARNVAGLDSVIQPEFHNGYTL